MSNGVSPCIDIHTHVVPENFPPHARGAADVAWPSMAPAHACHRHVMLSGKVYRTVPDGSWDVARRVAGMDAQWVGAPGALADAGAALVLAAGGRRRRALPLPQRADRRHGGARAAARFFGLGAVPLQDIDRAIAELEHLMGELGLRRRRDRQPTSTASSSAIRSLDAVLRRRRAARARRSSSTRCGPAAWSAWSGRRCCSRCWPFRARPASRPRRSSPRARSRRHPRLRIALSHGGGTLGACCCRGWRTRGVPCPP